MPFSYLSRYLSYLFVNMFWSNDSNRGVVALDLGTNLFPSTECVINELEICLKTNN